MVSPRPSAGPTATPDGAIDASDLWLINSTSGTTGLPKCVMQTQNRWRFFHQLAVEFGELGREPERFMSVVPAPFGFGLWTAHVTPTLLGAPCTVQPRFDALIGDFYDVHVAPHVVTLAGPQSLQYLIDGFYTTVDVQGSPRRVRSLSAPDGRVYTAYADDAGDVSLVWGDPNGTMEESHIGNGLAIDDLDLAVTENAVAVGARTGEDVWVSLAVR